ncbi:MAG TPA: transglycosylase SLT domain-containing protein [Candidatus Sulfotelmatobacter sp.]|nr:transglycosylase SLT domain-containing protein [Candidatus Sulfotelmatobacter sp.]
MLSARATPGIRRRLAAALCVSLVWGCAASRPGVKPAAPIAGKAPADTVRPVPPFVPRTFDWDGTGPPRRIGGRIEWRPQLPAIPQWAESGAGDGETGRPLALDSLELWRLRTSRPLVREPALLRMSALLAQRGDTAGADSALAVPDLARSIWAWDALQARERLALARGDTIGADSMLTTADTKDWLDTERANWTAEAARIAALRADTTRALDQARAAMRRYPALPGASTALRLAESIQAARHDSLSYTDARSAAEVEALRGSFGAATRRLAARLPSAERDQRAGLALRTAQVGRRARLFDTARASAIAAYRTASDTATRALALLERARIQRDARFSDSSLVTFARVAALAPAGETRGVALWERARELQDAGKFGDAAKAFERARAAGSRRDESRFLSGLMWFAAGKPDAALGEWARDTLESARFWRGVALRQRHDPRGEKLLRALAELPGYQFYRAAARDTLGLRGRGDSIEVAAPTMNDFRERSRELAEAGMLDEVMRLDARWLARDPRVSAARDSSLPSDALIGAELGWSFSRPWLTASLALQASREAEVLPVDRQWTYVPWAYPPAFDSLVVATADTMKLEPALLWATMRQESRFDPQARSTSNAVGLMQLLLPAAQDAARWNHEPKPIDDTPLLDPATNLQWGARYLARLIARFDGHIPVALSAYNAGASTVPPFWRDLIAHGGEALFCEFASNADAQDYARRILAYRQAYRELEPYVAR